MGGGEEGPSAKQVGKEVGVGVERVFSGFGSHAGSRSVNQSETQRPRGWEEPKPDPPPKGQALGTRERPKEPLGLTTWPRVPCCTKEASEACLPGAQLRGQ